MATGLIFPHQLFKDNPAIKACRTLIIAEDPLFFGDMKYPLSYHRKKLLLHRASMKRYAEFLRKQKKKVIYLDHHSLKSKNPADAILGKAGEAEKGEIHYTDTSDFELERRLTRAADRAGLKLKRFPSPGFLTEESFFDEVFGGRKSYLMAKFYTAQRIRLGILVDAGSKPTGGKWSFDDENRRRLPEGIQIPETGTVSAGADFREAVSYVNNLYPENPGSTDGFCYPVDHDSARAWLTKFLEERFAGFGSFEDAIDSERTFLFHSVLTPALNTGLLTPDEIVNTAIEFAEGQGTPLNSLEGFIRQIIGWREFIRLIYLKQGVRQRTGNFWGFSEKMPRSFYEGTTGILPFDTVVKRVIDNAYCHHIERLMILGNFMLLCEIDPDEVYRWFMELFIDAYDWVMVPNVYGMSQFADGGMMATKPYISSSNYILKMSNFKRGDWCGVWDGLYWRFIYRHKGFFRKNPRLSLMASQLDKMDKGRLKNHINNAEEFLSGLK